MIHHSLPDWTPLLHTAHTGISQLCGKVLCKIFRYNILFNCVQTTPHSHISATSVIQYLLRSDSHLLCFSCSPSVSGLPGVLACPIWIAILTPTSFSIPRYPIRIFFSNASSGFRAVRQSLPQTVRFLLLLVKRIPVSSVIMLFFQNLRGEQSISCFIDPLKRLCSKIPW